MNVYRSGFEMMVSNDLRARKIPFTYESHVLYFESTVRNGECAKCGHKKVVQRRQYTPDFVLYKAGRTPRFIEAKGILDAPTRSKMRAVKKSNPDADIRFLFQGKKTWKRSAGIIKWCDKFGFTYAFGHEVPDTWLS